MDIEYIGKNDLLLLNCVSGSKAYGLDTPQSDTDMKGVFFLPKREYYGLVYTDQVSNETNDEIYYELKRFIDLLVKNNPNIVELLNTPEDSILFKHPIMEIIKPELFLSKLCNQTFAGYAESQIKKAKGLNKKIINPVGKERKTILDFCYVINKQGSISFYAWLKKKGFIQEHCGLANIAHMKGVYALFHNSQLKEGPLKGICSGTEANDVSLSSVEKGIEPLGIMSFNKDGYSKYCKEYKEYWEWVDKRNDTRYKNTVEQGKNYDAKNMMHTFRLLNMAEEIAREGKVYVRRQDREFLLKIRSGAFPYDELVALAKEKNDLINELFEKSDLPDYPDTKKVEDILFEMRDHLYKM